MNKCDRGARTYARTDTSNYLNRLYVDFRGFRCIAMSSTFHYSHLPVDVVPVSSGLPTVGHLEEALYSAAAVLRPRAVHTVGQQHHQPGLQAPLGLPAADKRVLHQGQSIRTGKLGSLPTSAYQNKISKI